MNLPQGRAIRMEIISTPAHLPVVRAALEKICEMIGFDESAIGKVVLSVDEALTNIIRHAYKGDNEKPIEVELQPCSGDNGCPGLKIVLRDRGIAVDPSKIKGRALDDIRPGGLGVHIMHKCMDKLEYKPAEGGGTELTMLKVLPSEEEEKP